MYIMWTGNVAIKEKEQCGGDSPAGGEDDREDGQPLFWGQHGPVEEDSSGAGQADGQRGGGAEGQ